MLWLKLEGPSVWIVMVATFLILGTWESWRPRRPLATAAAGRWGLNGLLLLAAIILQAAVFRLGPVAAAAMVADSPWGLLNRPSLPFAVQFVAAILYSIWCITSRIGSFTPWDFFGASMKYTTPMRTMMFPRRRVFIRLR